MTNRQRRRAEAEAAKLARADALEEAEATQAVHTTPYWTRRVLERAKRERRSGSAKRRIRHRAGTPDVDKRKQRRGILVNSIPDLHSMR